MTTGPNTPAQLNAIMRPFLLVILVGALFLAFRILTPFINPIILAIVLAALFQPLQRRLTRLLPGRANLVAMGLVLLIALLIVLPFFVFLAALIDQGLQLSSTIKDWVQSGKLQELQQSARTADVMQWLQTRLPFVNFEQLDLQSKLLEAARILSEAFLRHGAGILGNLASLLTHFFIMMFILFYLIRDGSQLVRRVKELSPLKEEQEDRIFEKVSGVARSVFMGSLLTAMVQGLAGGVAMVVVGIPALFWGTMLAFASLIPVVGTALIWIPATGYLLLTGSWEWALFFALWNILVVGSIDNFLRPLLMGGKDGLSPFWIFLAILGGVQVFGLAGMLYGPLILGFATIMLLIYQEEFHDAAHTATAEASGPATPPPGRGTEPGSVVPRPTPSPSRRTVRRILLRPAQRKGNPSGS